MPRLPSVQEINSLPTESLAGLVVELAALTTAAAARWRTAPTAGEKPEAPDQREQLTAGEVAALLNVKVGWVYQHQKALGGAKLDGLLRFSRRRVLTYVDRQHRLAT
jgi:hypothetical protein